MASNLTTPTSEREEKDIEDGQEFQQTAHRPFQSSASSLQMLGQEFQHPLEKQHTSEDTLVQFDGDDDPYQPRNWSMTKKALTVFLFAMTTTTTTFASSVFSAAIEQVADEFHVSTIVASLGISLFLCGFGVGPLFWAPLSELYGRKIGVFIPVFVGSMFAFGGGAAKDVQTVMICRFFQALFASAPVANSGGVLADLFTPSQRGAAMAVYTITNIGGPMVGPLVGSALCVNPSLGWRWTQYITGIWAISASVVGLLFIDETFAPALLVKKARRLRLKGNWALHAKHEEWDVSVMELVRKYLIKPFQILMTPIGFLMATYQSFAFAIIYASLSALPVEFEEIRGWSQVVGSLPFLGMLLGVVLGALLNFWNQPYYLKRVAKRNGKADPEARLPPMIIGSVFFTAGLFMFAWSSSKSIFWLVPQIGIVMYGFGFMTIMNSCHNYVVDTFQQYAASAMAGLTFSRSAFAVGFPLFTPILLNQLGVSWGLSIFAFIAAAMMPIPFVFFVFGERIRAKGKRSLGTPLNA